jgi:hypothetical protein
MRTSIISGIIIAAMVFAGYYVYKNYFAIGKKITINDKSNVFIKNDATEDEAQRLGSFLIASRFFNNQTEKSVQLQKENDLYTVRFPVNEDELKANPNGEETFQYMQMRLRDSVFGGRSVRVILSDHKFKDIKTVSELNPPNPENGIPATPPGTQQDSMKAAPGSSDSTINKRQLQQSGKQTQQPRSAQ